MMSHDVVIYLNIITLSVLAGSVKLVVTLFYKVLHKRCTSDSWAAGFLSDSPEVTERSECCALLPTRPSLTLLARLTIQRSSPASACFVQETKTNPLQTVVIWSTQQMQSPTLCPHLLSDAVKKTSPVSTFFPKTTLAFMSWPLSVFFWSKYFLMKRNQMSSLFSLTK